jgi:hypothetical protein
MPPALAPHSSVNRVPVDRVQLLCIRPHSPTKSNQAKPSQAMCSSQLISPFFLVVGSRRRKPSRSQAGQIRRVRIENHSLLMEPWLRSTTCRRTGPHLRVTTGACRMSEKRPRSPHVASALQGTTDASHYSHGMLHALAGIFFPDGAREAHQSVCCSLF